MPPSAFKLTIIIPQHEHVAYVGLSSSSLDVVVCGSRNKVGQLPLFLGLFHEQNCSKLFDECGCFDSVVGFRCICITCLTYELIEDPCT